MTDLEAYYNKFNEEKRLDSRHGRVEFVTSMHYIHQCLDEIVKERAKEEIHILAQTTGLRQRNHRKIFSDSLHFPDMHALLHPSVSGVHQCLDEIVKERAKEEIHILDIGAGTGRYSVPLAQEGFDVTAVELVKHNLGRLKQKGAECMHIREMQ